MWYVKGPKLAERAAHNALYGVPRSEEEIKAPSTESYARARDAPRPKDVQEFLKTLRMKFGSVTRGWRMVLDVEGIGKLDFCSFVGALRDMGCGHNARSLWFNLDMKQFGTISLYDLDPVAAHALDKFRYKCTSTYGTMEAAFGKMDEERSGMISLSIFSKFIGVVFGYEKKEAEELFRFLARNRGACGLTLHDVAFLQTWEDTKKKAKETKSGTLRWVNKDPSAAHHYSLRGEQFGASKAGAAEQPPHCCREDAPATIAAVKASGETLGIYATRFAAENETAFSKFIDFLQQKFESLAAAWDVMDPSENGSLWETEFQNAVCFNLGYCRNAEGRRLFQAMPKQNSNCVTWRDLGVSAQEWIEYLTAKKWQGQLKRNEVAHGGAAGQGAKKALQDRYRRAQKQVARLEMAFGEKAPPPTSGTPLPSWSRPSSAASARRPVSARSYPVPPAAPSSPGPRRPLSARASGRA